MFDSLYSNSKATDAHFVNWRSAKRMLFSTIIIALALYAVSCTEVATPCSGRSRTMLGDTECETWPPSLPASLDTYERT